MNALGNFRVQNGFYDACSAARQPRRALGLVGYIGHTSLAAGIFYAAMLVSHRRRALRSTGRA